MPHTAFSRPLEEPPAWAAMEGDPPVHHPTIPPAPHAHIARWSYSANTPYAVTVVQVCTCGAVRRVEPHAMSTAWVGAPEGT